MRYTPDKQPNLGELELMLIEKLKARTGGFLMIAFTLPLLALCWRYELQLGYWFFGICLMFWSVMTFSIHNDIQQIRERIKIKLGVTDD